MILKPILFGIFCISLILIIGIVSAIPSSYASTVQVAITQGSGSGQGCVSAGNCFDPNVIQINLGDSVTWTNYDSVGHTVTSGLPTDNVTGTSFDSSTIVAGGSYSIIFSYAGTYNYFDQIHPWMVGQVIVSSQSQTQQQIRNYYVYVDPLPDYAPSYASSLIYDATKAWMDANPDIKFWAASDIGHADLYIQWIKDYGNNPLGETISGHTIQIGLGDSNRCGEKWQPFSSQTLHHIAEHEIGHFLGLQHSSDPSSIMYPTIDASFGTVEFEQNLAPAYFWFVPICSTKDLTSYYYSVSIDDPKYGIDVYFIPSKTEYDNAKAGNSFQYYSGDGCHAENYLSYANTCDGVGAGSGLLIMTDKIVTNGLTKVTVKMTEQPTNTNSVQSTISLVHQYRNLSESEQAQQATTQAEMQKSQAEAEAAQAQAAASEAQAQAKSLKAETEVAKAKAQSDIEKAKAEAEAAKAQAQKEEEKTKLEAENKVKHISQAFDKKTFYRVQIDEIKNSLKDAEQSLSGLKFESSDATTKLEQAWKEKSLAEQDIQGAENYWQKGSDALNKTDGSLAMSYFDNISSSAISSGKHLSSISDIVDDAKKAEEQYKKSRFCFLWWCW